MSTTSGDTSSTAGAPVRRGVPPSDGGGEHLDHLQAAVHRLRADTDLLQRWGRRLAVVLSDGGRLLAAGNGGSAAQAQHLTAELVGRYRGERRPLSAIALHADTSTLTALVNDYGPDAMFSRQVRAHGRRGDVLVALSTSGASSNVLRAVAAARDQGLQVLALTGPAPNPLARAADEALVVDADPPTVQEVHQVAVHLICASLDAALAELCDMPDGGSPPRAGSGHAGGLQVAADAPVTTHEVRS
jgi:D-sedoheptulose 7-phosphate isomerase